MTAIARRNFLRFLMSSPLGLTLSSNSLLALPEYAKPTSLKQALTIEQLNQLARETLPLSVYHSIVDGAEGGATVQGNRQAFQQLAIRARRLVDVSQLDTSLTLFSDDIPSPILMAPVGNQLSYHPQAELATANAGNKQQHVFIAPTLASQSIQATADTGGTLWFQLYPFSDREIMRRLIAEAEQAGCKAIVLTIDSAARGKHESQQWFRLTGQTAKTPFRAGNFPNIKDMAKLGDPTLSWDIVTWLKQTTTLPVLLKGIVTHEDAALALQHGADGIIVSNHGGRQEPSHRSSLACLPEIVATVQGKVPVLMDGGIRRGSDIFKALALGADAVCVGRPYIWGLAAGGEAGVRKSLRILQDELEQVMALAGTASLTAINQKYVTALSEDYRFNLDTNRHSH